MPSRRIKGGEINTKSGIVWSRDELRKVLDLYLVLEGKQIHETNKKIISLGQELARTTRSVEAQLIIFRNIEKGKLSGLKNMNSICLELWNEKLNGLTTTSKMDTTQLFPTAFKKWSSASSGGVRKPFDKGTGRPTINRVVTNMDTRFAQLLKDTRYPKILFLVGGPGNGKTDTLECLVEMLDKDFGLSGKLIASASSAYKEYPRKVCLNLKELADGLPASDLWLVQDASERDHDEHDAASSLISDLESIINGNFYGIYVCCINRGVLDRVRRELRNDVNSNKYKLLSAIQTAVSPLLQNKKSTSSSEISIWPMAGMIEGCDLEEKCSVYVWPMDLESLLQKCLEGNVPFEDLLNSATNEDQWKVLGKEIIHDPSLANRLSLSNATIKSSFSSYLRAFELISGKRFTFRDMLSLICHLLNVDQVEIEKMNSTLAKSTSPFLEKFEALHSLYQDLWHVRLFPWRISNGSRKQVLGIFQGLKSIDNWSGDLYSALNCVESILRKRKVLYGTYIERILDDVGFKELDPASCNSSEPIGDSGISFGEIDRYYSKGIRIGLEKTGILLTAIEYNYLEMLCEVEEKSLDQSLALKTRLSDLPFCLGTLRKYAAIVAKRSIGLHYSIFNNSNKVKLFLSALTESEAKQEVKKKLYDAIFPESKLKISFTSSLAQPPESVKNNAYIALSPIPLSDFKIVSVNNSNNIPKWDHLTIKLNRSGHIIDTYVNLSNYLNLIKLSAEGSLAGCIPPEILLWKDQILSALTAREIRDTESLASEYIFLDNKEKILINANGKFRIEH